MRLRLAPTSKGYRAVELSHKGNRAWFYVHRLVLTVFRGPCPEGMETRHVNGVKTDNRLVNIVWGTPEENEADKVRHGTDRRGEDVPNARLSEADVRAIRDMHIRDGISLREIGRVLGVSRSAVRQAFIGETWRHVIAA